MAPEEQCPKMLPGETPYTPEELELLYRLVHEAAEHDPGEQGDAPAPGQET